MRGAATSTITYQGKLEENGQPVDGSRSMDFALSPVNDCSSLVAGFIGKTVSLTDGLFAVDLGFNADVFDGQALWLAIQVEGTDVACQPLRAAPYANTLRPGTTIQSPDGTALNVVASGSTGGDDGIRAEQTEGDGVVGFSDGTGDLDNGVIGFTDGGYGVYAFSNAVGQYAGYFDGPIRADSCTGCTTRYVARNDSDRTLRLGDVVRPAGVSGRTADSAQPVILAAPAARGDSVLGVVVGRTTRTVSDGSEDDVKAGVHWGPTGGSAEPGDYVVIVTQGLAKVRVDPAASTTVGDRLQLGDRGATRASSDEPFAMVLEDASTRSSADLVWALIGAP